MLAGSTSAYMGFMISTHTLHIWDFAQNVRSPFIMRILRRVLSAEFRHIYKDPVFNVNTFNMFTAYERFLAFSKENMSSEEYAIIASHPDEIIDITILACAHAHTMQIFHVKQYTTPGDCKEMLYHLAKTHEDFTHFEFVNKHLDISAAAFFFYLNEIKDDFGFDVK